MLWCARLGRGSLRNATIGLGILVVLFLVGLVLAPQFIDLDRFRGPIAAQLAERTGLPIEIAGPIDLSLLPSPTLTARDVRVANPPGMAAPNMVRLQALDVKLAVLPLLTGRLELRSATLVDPEIDIERRPDGALNWRSVVEHRGARNATSEAGSSTVGASGLDRLAIQNGAITWRSDAGIERFEHINAAATQDAEIHEIHAAGTLVARGAALSFDLRSGALGAAELPVQLTVTMHPAAQLQLDAELSGPPEERKLAGTLKFTGENAGQVFGTLAQMQLPAGLAQPVSISGQLGGSLRALSLENLSVDLGPAHAAGSLHLAAGAPPKISLSLSVPQLDLDHWPAARKAARVPSAASPAFAGTAGEATIPVAGSSASAVPALPANIVLSLDLGVEATSWRGGLVRNVHLQLSLAHGKLRLERFTAQLPGGSDASLSGTAALAPSGAKADAVFEASADDLRSLLGWLAVPINSVPPDRLLRATLSGRLGLDGDRIDLTDLDAVVDATRLSGAATILLRARPGIGLRLAADGLNLDAYLPRSGVRAEDAGAMLARMQPLLASVDANIDGRIRTLTWHGQPLSDLHLSATLQNGETTIHELSVGDAAGVGATLSGVVQELAGAPTGQLAFDMHGSEFERLLRLVAPRLVAGRSYGAFSLGGGMQYDNAAVNVDADLGLLDGHAHLFGKLVRSTGKLDLGFEADHPSFERLVRSLSPTYEPAADPGPIKLTGRLDGDLRRFTLENLALTIGQSTLAGTLGVDLTAARPHFDADFTAGDWAIDRLLSQRQTAEIDRRLEEPAIRPGIVLAAMQPPAAPGSAWPRTPFKLAALRRADGALKLSARRLAYGNWSLETSTLSATLQDGVLALTQLSGKALGGELDASGSLDARAVPAMQTQVALKGADFKSVLGSAMLEGQFDLDATMATAGGSAAELVAHAAGQATVKSQGGSIGGVDLDAADKALATHPANLATLLRGAAGGRTRFSSLTGSFHITDGVAASDDLSLAAAGGEGRATARIDLPNWTLASRIELRLAAASAAPPLVLLLDGSLDAPRTVFEINALQQYLARGASAAKPATR